jgi:hypothetical protein
MKVLDKMIEKNSKVEMSINLVHGIENMVLLFSMLQQ